MATNLGSAILPLASPCYRRTFLRILQSLRSFNREHIYSLGVQGEDRAVAICCTAMYALTRALP